MRPAVRLLIVTALSALLAAVALASLAPSSARAGDVCVGHPSDPSVVCVRNDDRIVDVCDRENDTHRVYARVITEASNPNFESSFYDDNGSNAGCGNFTFPSRVLSVAVCVQTEGCSAFKQTGPPAAPSVPPPAPPPNVPPPPAAPSVPPPVAESSAAPPAGPVIYAAGDISCAAKTKDPKTCRARATYDKIRELETQRGKPGLPSAVLALGDIQYETGSFNAFMQNYDPDWGLLKPVTFPALGNHEYKADMGMGKDKAEGYWKYFDPGSTNRFGVPGKGWYAFNRGSWRIYAINSNCAKLRGKPGPVSCARGSKQYNWLRRDMHDHPRRCRLMFMHHPYWDSSKTNFDTRALRPLIEAFSARGGDVVLAGHAHDYERFARSNPDQKPVSAKRRGFRMFIVGTGGKNQIAFSAKKPESNSVKRNDSDHGVLQLTLGSPKYQWRFVSAVNTGGSVFSDSGTGRCSP